MEKDLINTSNAHRKYELSNGNLFLEKIFGDEDAKNEWRNSSEESYRNFVHTESYENFKKLSLLFLLGRRGTGKTAMIRMLDYEIKKNITKEYNYCSVFSQDKSFYKLTTILRSSAFSDLTEQELIHAIKEKWMWVIYVEAMIAVYVEESKDGKLPNELKNVEKFLRDQNLIPSKYKFLSKKALDRAVGVLEDEISKSTHKYFQIADVIIKATKALFEVGFEEALEELIEFLNKENRKCLILLDSKELYNTKDVVNSSVTTALIESVLEVYSNCFETKIYAKAAFPSEMYPHFSQSNTGKTESKTHFIMWRFHDIVSFIYKRYNNVLKLPANAEKCDCRDQRECIYKFLPRAVNSFNDVYFDTIAYIIKHSQKKPRQIIQIFNTILSLADKNNIKFGELTELCIKEGTNIRLDILANEVYNMYSKIYDKANLIIRKTFKDTKNLTSLSEIHKNMQDASQLLKNSDMDREEAERLFLESGLIGIVQSERKYNESKKIVEALFEYQVKDILSINKTDKLVIHPMFYQSLHILAEKDIFVYPIPAEDELDENHYVFDN